MVTILAGMATKSHPDWAILEKIGDELLIAAGVSQVLIKSWRYRGIPWNKRGLVLRLAKQRRIKVPPNFYEHRPEGPRASAA